MSTNHDELINNRDELTNLEDSAFGRWFPRIGVLALLVGVGFAFKYAVDRGVIGPQLRVTMGIILGFGLIVAGEATRRRGWKLYAQAVSGGGIAILYLSIWASFHLYELLGSSEAFISLIAIAGLATLLAMRHNELPLAVIGTLGGFVNPLLLGNVMGPTTYLVYTVALSAGVIVLATLKDWSILDRIALAGAWLIFAISGARGPSATAFATTIFVLFIAVHYLQVVRGRRRANIHDGVVMVMGPIAYYLAMLDPIAVSDGDQLGWFTLGLGLFYIAQAVALVRLDPEERILRNAALVVGGVLMVIWVPIHFPVHATAGPWAVEGFALVTLARYLRTSGLRDAGVVLLGLSFGGTVVAMIDYDPAQLILSTEGLSFVAQITALYAVAVVALRDPEIDPTWAGIAAGAAGLLTLIWLGIEAEAAIIGDIRTARAERLLAFTLSATWGVYATIMLIVGVAFKLRAARLMALALFGLTLVKVVLQDVWMLESLHRVIVFMGLGALLLMSSLMYHRFKELMLRTS